MMRTVRLRLISRRQLPPQADIDGGTMRCGRVSPTFAEMPPRARRALRLLRRVTWAMAVTGVACGEPTAPCGTVERVLTTADDATLRSVDPDGRCGQRRVDLGGHAESVVLSPDHSRAYVVVLLASGQREFAAIDIASMAVVSRDPLSSLNVADTSIGAATGELAAVSEDGSAIYLWRTIGSGVIGLARFDLRSRQVTAFSGPWNLVQIELLKANTPFPEGTLVVVGLRTGGGPLRGRSLVYFLDQVTLEITDSILPSAIGGEEHVWQFVPAPDGSRAYMVGATKIVSYDFAQRVMVASTDRQATGMLSINPDGNRLILTDAGTWPDSPGSGLLRLYDANLSFLGVIDVSTPLAAGPHSIVPIRTGFAVASRDGRRFFVRSGSEIRGPLYPSQPARVLTVDVGERRLLRAVPLGGFGSSLLILEARQNAP